MNSRDDAVRNERAYRHNGDRSPAEIEEEIEQTRADMDHTIDAIQRKLSPGQMLDQVIDRFRSSPANDTASAYASGIDNAVRRNPIAVTLVGVGLGWLMLGSGEPRRDARLDARRDIDYSRTDALYRDEGGGLGESMRDMVHQWRESWDDTRKQAGESAHGLRERWDEMRGQASGAAHGLRERMGSQRERYGDKSRELRERTGQYGRQARHQIDRARSSIGEIIEEQPLVVGALGLALGAVLAATLPGTRREDELFGDTREQLKHRAEETGREHMEQMREAGEQVVDKARESAEQAVDSVREAGERRMEETRHEAQARSGTTHSPGSVEGGTSSTEPASTPGKPRS